MKIGSYAYSPPEVDRIWLRVYYNKIPIYPPFYLLKGDYIQSSAWVKGLYGYSAAERASISSRCYLEGQGDLVSRVITRITRVTIWVIGVINLLTKSP